MVHKVLSIVASILFGLLTIAFVICLIYTVASPAVQSGLEEISSSVRGIADSVSSAASQATDAIDAGWQAAAGAATSGAAAVSGVTSGEAVASAAGTANATTASVSANSDTGAGGFADAAQGQAYLGWKAAIADPVGRVFSGAGITEELLEGVAGGSLSAQEALTSLDEATLAAVSANASSYAATAAANTVPSSLPEGVRSQLWEANSAAQSFAAAVQSAVTALQGGDLLSLGDLMSAADTAVQSVRTMDECMASAEAALK